MKNLSSSVGFQGPDGTLLKFGSLMLTLPDGIYEVIAGGGQVAGGTVILNFDVNAKVVGTPQMWCSDELTGHPIFSVQLCSLANGLGPVSQAQWDISGASPIDLATMVSTSLGISFPLAVLQKPAGNQTIASGDLILGTGNFNAVAGTYEVNGVAPTGSGPLVAENNPTIHNPSLTTPSLDAATATTINKVAITQPATGATLTIADGKTLKADNSLELAGTDNTKHTFPATAPTGGVLAYGGPSFQKFTGSGTFTIPVGVTAVKVTLVAGGGGGGGATATNNGAGGGSGGAAVKYLSGLTPQNTILVTVGAAGTAGGTGAAGGTGGNSTIASGTQTITTVTAFGGVGGNGNGAQSSGGPGGAIATNADLPFGGNTGNDGIGITGGAGAGSIFAGGGPNSNGGNPGIAALSTGGGGGGAGSGGNRSGGAGAAGIVIFEWVS
jgi:hypothetical protein